MGQKVNPVGLRIGINRKWTSNWAKSGHEFSTYIVQDIKIRQLIEKNPNVKASILSHVEISRSHNDETVSLHVYIHVKDPGVILGDSRTSETGKVSESTIQKIDKAVKALAFKDEKRKVYVRVEVVQVAQPELDANIVAQQIANLLEKRESFKAVQKRQIKATMAAGAKGIKTEVSGRLGGAEIARSEWYKDGTIPLHTIKNDIDYAIREAHTTYGRLGVKVWISRGEYKNDKGE